MLLQVSSQPKYQAFTLLEVLICIFVMGIGILSVVWLMTNNINTIDRVHTQTIATTLAREGMEMVTNVRDTNSILWYEWNCAERLSPNSDGSSPLWNDENSLCKNFFRTGDNSLYAYTIDWWLDKNSTQIIMKRLENDEINLSGSRLYLRGIQIGSVNITGYTHNTSGIPTNFWRYIEFTGMASLPNNSPIRPNDILPVRSRVLFDRNGTTGEIILESFIANKE